MPKIPSAESITRLNPGGGAPVLNVGGADPRLDAAAGLVESVQDVMNTRDQYQLNRANALFMVAKTGQDNAYDNDSDYGTIVERYNKSTGESLDKIAQTISNPRVRNMFMQNQKVALARGQEHIKKIAWGKEKDTERGNINTSLNDLRDAGMMGNVIEARQMANGLLESAVGAGYYSAEEKSKVLEAFTDSVALGKLKLAEPEDRLELLSHKDITKHLSPDVVAQLKREAKVAQLEKQATITVDGYLGKGLSREEALEKISTIKDPKLRRETESRYDYMYAAQEKAEFETQQELHEKYYLDIRQGKSFVKDIPNADLQAMTSGQINNLFNAEAASVKPARSYSDRGVIDTLNMYYANKMYKEGRQFFTENAALLTQTDFDKWSKVTAEGTAPPEIKYGFSSTQVLNSKLEVAGIADDATKAKITSELIEWVDNYIADNDGRTPTETDRNRQIDALLEQYDTDPDAWVFGWKKRVFDMDDEEKLAVLADMKDSDPEIYKDVVEGFKTAGYQPSAAELMTEFTRLRDQRNAAK